MSGEAIMKTNSPEEIFRSAGGQLRMSEALEKGISRYMLYKMRDEGIVEQFCRGVYRLSNLPSIGNPDLVTVSLRIPNAVICLVSALAFHELSTQIPHAVDIALPRTARNPAFEYPKILVHRFNEKSWSSGIETHVIDAVSVRVYCPEKTLADCFRFRNQIGMDIILESLKLYSSRTSKNYDAVFQYAKINRVEKTMYPYLEAFS
jgi:predicted transcriptional regulator of viral defense system